MLPIPLQGAGQDAPAVPEQGWGGALKAVHSANGVAVYVREGMQKGGEAQVKAHLLRMNHEDPPAIRQVFMERRPMM